MPWSGQSATPTLAPTCRLKVGEIMGSAILATMRDASVRFAVASFDFLQKGKFVAAQPCDDAIGPPIS